MRLVGLLKFQFAKTIAFIAGN